MIEEKDFYSSHEKSEEKDIKKILSRYWNYKYLFGLSIGLSCIGAYFYTRYDIPKYKITSTLLIEDDKLSPNLSASDFFNDLDITKSEKSVENEIQVIKSLGLMQRVLKELSLNMSFHIKGRVNDVELYGDNVPVKIIFSKLNPLAYGKQIIMHINDNNSFQLEEDENNISIHSFGEEIEKAYGIFTVISNFNFSSKEAKKPILIRFYDPNKQALAFNAKLSVAPVEKGASVLALSMVDEIPKRGKDIINKLIEVYNDEELEINNQVASNTIKFIDDRLKYITSDLSEVEKNIENFKRKNELIDMSSQAKLYVEEASEYNRQIASSIVQQEILESIKTYLENQSNDFHLVPSSLTIEDYTLASLVEKFNELQLERERILRNAKTSNPVVTNINDQLLNLKVNILENIKNITQSLGIKKESLETSINRYKLKIKEVPTIERELVEIDRQYGIKKELYLYLLKKREEASLSLAASISSSRVIDSAISSHNPINPGKSLIMLAAILLGFFISIGIIYIKSLFYDKVQILNDVKIITNTPILGEVLHNTGKDRVITEKTKGQLSEMFRLIRANLLFSDSFKNTRTLMVTSSINGEGKTFFSINLGASLALAGKKVVLLGFDLRKPQLMQQLNLPDYNFGISTYLKDQDTNPEEILIPTGVVEGLDIIGSGPIPENPTELMISNRVNELITRLKEKYQYIIIDTPPVGLVADALSLCSLVDSTIYLIRYNYSNKKQIETIENLCKEKILKNPMIVLNDAKKENSNSYGYQYSTI
jgi:tyrosine-protein kinase Etk/Wzc